MERLQVPPHLRANAYDPEAAAKLLELTIAAENERPGTLTGYDCQKCKNKGYTYIAVEGSRVAKECECISRRKCLRHIDESGLSGLLGRCTFDSFIVQQPWQNNFKKKAGGYISHGRGKWFAALGQTGCGKTHLCTALCGELLERGYAVRYITWVGFIRKMERLRFKAEEREAFFKPIAEAQVLYVDDFLKREMGDFALATAWELVDYREKGRLSTIISGELFVDEIADQDAALASRIKQMCGPYLMEIVRDNDRNWRLREDTAAIGGRADG